MALPSFSPIELQVLLSIIAVLIFIGSFLALLVSVIFGLGLVRQGCECKPRVGEPHLFGIFGKHTVGGLNQLALVLGGGLAPRFFDAMANDELMHFSHVCTMTSLFPRCNVGVWSLRLLGSVLILFY